MVCVRIFGHEWSYLMDANRRHYKYCLHCPSVIHEWEEDF